MARLFAGENFPLPAVEELRRLGHDVQTALEAGRANLGVPDADVLAYAAGEGRAVLTLNRRHFVRLHSQPDPHAGIVACTRDEDFAALAFRIHEALRDLPDLHDGLVRVNRPQRPATLPPPDQAEEPEAP